MKRLLLAYLAGFAAAVIAAEAVIFLTHPESAVSFLIGCLCGGIFPNAAALLLSDWIAAA